MNYTELMGVCDELSEYAEIEGSELGEYCNLLIDLAHYGYCVRNESFAIEFDREIVEQLTNFKENTRIIEEIVERPSYMESRLEWLEPIEEE